MTDRTETNKTTDEIYHETATAADRELLEKTLAENQKLRKSLSEAVAYADAIGSGQGDLRSRKPPALLVHRHGRPVVVFDVAAARALLA